MSTIADRLNAIKRSLPAHVRLVAVSKFHPAEAIREAYEAGQRRFAESRVQELLVKEPQLPSDIIWHFIGHLQSNKVRKIVGHVSLIESVDSEHLLEYIDRISAEVGVVSRVLLQVHVAAEETKFGFSPDELLEYFSSRRFETLKATHICGIMAMASNTDDEARVRDDFESAASVMARVREMCPDLRGFDILSMGMSGDYPLAIECGSDMVRIGTAIFGERQY